ncbi:MAG: SoxR reducing system RseC family protein [Wenzhouxiangella sp.]
MRWQIARVVQCTPEHMTLQFDPPSSCERCDRGEGCGAGAFSRLFARRGATLKLPLLTNAKEGDWVRVGVDERRLLLASLHVYGWPLGVFLAALVLAQGLTSGLFWQDLAALLLALLAAATCLQVLRKRQPDLNPVVEQLSCSKQSRST